MRQKWSVISMMGLLIVLACIGIVSHERRPNVLNDNQKEAERMVSFFQADYVPLLTGIKEEALASPLIVEIEGTGNWRYVHGDLIQEISFVQVIRGTVDEKKAQKKMYLTGNGWSEGDNCVSTGFINYLQKGNHYIVFATKLYEDYEKESVFLKANVDMPGLRCLNISSDESEAYLTDEEQVCYAAVRASEFFCNDKKTLRKMEKYKKEMLNQLGVKVLWNESRHLM